MRQTEFLSLFGPIHALAVKVSFRDQRRNNSRFAVIPQGNINTIGSIGMNTLARDGVFGYNFYARLHRCSSSVTHLSGQINQIPYADGLTKHHLINHNRYNSALGVAHAGQGTGFIDQFHNPAAVHVAMAIGMRWLHHLSDIDT